jgi:hypothetical protein
MPDNSLLQQLASRAKTFHSNTGIPQTQMAKAIGMEASNYNSFLQGKKGLGAEATCLLLKVIAMSKGEAIAKFSKPAPTSKILHFQQNDISKMRLAINDGFVPGQSGIDPYDPTGNGIDSTPDADTSGPVWDQSFIDVLREARGYHYSEI